MKSKFTVLILFFVFISAFVEAQVADSSLVQIETLDGNEFLGTIVKEDALIIVLKTANLGEITIQKKDIKSRIQVLPRQIKEGKLWFANPQSTRYFWAPNGYGLKKGEGYYQNIYVMWNQFAVGVTDNFSLGGGIIPIFLFGGGPTPFFITSKFSIPIEKDKINLGAGALLGTVIGGDTGGYGMLFGMSTFGSPDSNLSVGLGYGFADGDWANSPLINVSGLVRFSRRGYFISENYFLNTDGEVKGVLGLGGRWIIKKAALDFIFFSPLGVDSFVIVPGIGFTIPFGNKSR